MIVRLALKDQDQGCLFWTVVQEDAWHGICFQLMRSARLIGIVHILSSVY